MEAAAESLRRRREAEARRLPHARAKESDMALGFAIKQDLIDNHKLSI